MLLDVVGKCMQRVCKTFHIHLTDHSEPLPTVSVKHFSQAPHKSHVSVHSTRCPHAGSQVIVDSTELSQLIEPGPAQPIVLCLIWRRVGFAYSASNIDGCPGWIWVTSWICSLPVSETTDGPWTQLFTTFMTIGGRVLVAGAKNKALVAQVFDFVGPGQKGSGPSCGLLVGPPRFFIMAVFPTWGVSFAAICCMFPRFQKSCLSLRKKGEKRSHIR